MDLDRAVLVARFGDFIRVVDYSRSEEDYQFGSAFGDALVTKYATEYRYAVQTGYTRRAVGICLLDNSAYRDGVAVLNCHLSGDVSFRK